MNDSAVSVRYSSDGHVGSIVFDRPKANSYDLGFLRQLDAVVDRAEVDEGICVVLVQSALGRVFSAGADIHAFAAYSAEAKRKLADLDRRIVAKIESSPKIFVAAISGHALGGGLEFALACDIRLGADGDFLLGLPEEKLGLMPGNGGTQRLARVVGVAKALELSVSGNCIDSLEAFRIGLLHRVFATDKFAEEVESYVSLLAAGAPLAMAAAKRAIRQGAEVTLAEGLVVEESLAKTLYETADAAEGMAAFLEKREPKFHGR